MRVKRVTEKNGYVEYHVDKRLRGKSSFTPAGIRVERIIVLSGLPSRDYSYINKQSFTVKTDEVDRQKFIDLVNEYGDMSPSLRLSWNREKHFETLEVVTDIAFSSSDDYRVKSCDSSIIAAQRFIPEPCRRMVIKCSLDINRQAIENTVREILG